MSQGVTRHEYQNVLYAGGLEKCLEYVKQQLVDAATVKASEPLVAPREDSGYHP
jgi:hypothetical protein